MSRRRETDVLVTGAGPVGLCAALHLAELGLRVHLVDQGRRAALHSYGLALHPATLRLLDEKRLAMPLMAHGLLASRVAFYQGRERLATLPVEEATADFPAMLVCPQSALEAVLTGRLTELGVTVNWNHRVASLEPGAAGARLRVDRLEEVNTGYAVMRYEREVLSSYDVEARFVVGADGAESFLRGRLGLEYRETGPERRFDVFEFEVRERIPREMCVVLHEETVNVLWPLPEGRVRWTFEAGAGEPEPPGPERLLALLRQRAPWFEAAPGDIYWEASVRFGQRLVDRWGRGAVWLAGDAAHLTYPMGVQGMNIGLREARDLADCLARLFRGEPASALEDYERERAAEWTALLGPGAGARPSDAAPEWVRRHAARLAPCLPGSGESLARLRERLGL